MNMWSVWTILICISPTAVASIMLSDYLSLSVVDVTLTVAVAPEDYSEAITATSQLPAEAFYWTYCESFGK